MPHNLRRIREDVNLAYKDAVIEGFRASIRSNLKTLFHKVRRSHDLAIAQHYRETNAKLYPAFHVHLQILSLAKYIEIGSIQTAINTVLQGMLEGKNSQKDSTRSLSLCLCPINGISLSAMNIALEIEKRISFLEKLTTRSDQDDPDLNLAEANKTSIHQAEDQAKQHAFSWPPWVTFEESSSPSRSNTIIILLDTHAHRGQIHSLMNYFQRLHALYGRFEMICAKALKADFPQEKRNYLMQYAPPNLPQVIFLLIRSNLSCVSSPETLIPHPNKLVCNTKNLSDERDKLANHGARKRTFGDMKLHELLASPVHGLQHQWKPYISTLRPFFASAPSSSPIKETSASCLCFFCRLNVSKTTPKREGAYELKFCNDTFISCFFNQWQQKYPKLVISKQLKFQLEFFLNFKSEGLSMLSNAFFAAVLKHISEEKYANGDQVDPQYRNTEIGKLS